MSKEKTPINGCYILTLFKHEDERGNFRRIINPTELKALGLDKRFTEINSSSSKKGVLRGIHFQTKQPQGKLVTCLKGKIWDVCVDLRKDSPTYKQWYGIELTPDNGKSIYVPEGCGHGFIALEDSVITYGCTTEHYKASDTGIRWNDPTIAIKWPEVEKLIISDKDAKLPFFTE